MTYRPGVEQNSRDKAASAERPVASGAFIFVTVTTLFVAAVALICVFRPFSLQFPASGLDPAWVMVMGEAALRPARWGVELTFTYGPASALVTRYFTDNYFYTTLPTMVAFALVQALCIACLVVSGTARQRHPASLALLCVAAFGAALLSNATLDPDGLFFTFALIVFLLDLRCPGRSSGLARAAVLLGAAVLGVAALAKTSYGIAGLLLVVLADVDSLARRRIPLLTPLFMAGFLLAFTAFGQRLGDLPTYILMQGQVAAGYGEALYIDGSRGELIIFVGLGAALLLAVGACELRLRRGFVHRIAAPLGVALLLLIAFKAGFIRQDTHPQIAWGVLGFSGLSLAVSLFLPRSRGAAALVGGASLLVLWVVAPLCLLRETQQKADLTGLIRTYGEWIDSAGNEAESLGRFADQPSGVLAEARAAKAEALQHIRSENPLPRLQGTVDMLPSDQGTLLANGLDYHPRPSFAEYSTYTAALIAANKAFYEGDRAPDWVLFDLGGLDGRYPAMTEGEIWPELLRRYEPARRTGTAVALHRRDTPLPEVLGPSESFRAKLGEPYVVPSRGPLFARIDVRKTILGRMAAAVFRPPALTMRVTLSTGQEISYRFIPALGAGGFLLTPMIDDPREFADLGFGLTGTLEDKAVTQVVIGGSRLATWFYESEVGIALQPVELKDVRLSAGARSFYEEWAKSQPQPPQSQ